MELWDIYDKERIRTGRTMERGSQFLINDFHLVVHICIFNSKDEMLVQQRQPFKEGWPNMWDITVGGSALAGEKSQTAAERELFEEIGFKVDLTNERPFITVNFRFGFDDYYLLENNLDIRELTLQYEEVQRVKWANKSEVLNMLDEGIFIPYHRHFIETLFEMRRCPGAIARNE